MIINMGNKCTLIIDGNWLLQSRFSVMNKNFKIELPVEIKNKATQELTDLMAKSINVILNRFNFIDNIILVSDGGSWRKNIKKPPTREGIEYKGNREPQKEFDWNYIWPALKVLSNNFIKNNITYSCAYDIEGDDWVWYWTRKLNKQGTNCIIWSSDNDLKQLVNKDDNTGAITMWYNDRNGGFISSELECKDEDVLDFFMKPVYFNQTLENIKKILKDNIHYIYPSDIILNKIMCGDSGDNIKPVASFEKNGRTYNITEKIWCEISDRNNIININNLIGNEGLVAGFIKEYKKFKKEIISEQDIHNNIIYNTQMVWLDESIIPEECIKKMDEVEYKLADINYIKHNYKVLCDNDEEVEEIFNEIENLFN